MSGAITGIDHTIVGVADLERGRRTYERLGFTVTPRGRHLGWGTANYCIMFPGNYVELLGIVDPGRYAAGLDEVLAERGEGLIGLALATGDAGRARGELAAAGLNPREVEDLARDLELPEGTVRPRFALVHLPPEETPCGRMFVCQHLTPELMRRPGWLRHANGAVALAGVTVHVGSPPTLAEPCRALFGAGNVTAAGSGLSVRVGDQSITLSPHDDPGRTDLPPRMVAMRIAVDDQAATARVLAAGGVPFSPLAEGGLRVAAADACGVILDFADSRSGRP